MWPFSQHSARRREIRRSKSESRVPFPQRVLQRLGAWPIVIAVLFGIGAGVILNAGGVVLPWRVGMYAPHGVNARIGFRKVDDNRTLLRRTQAHDNSPNFYVLDAPLVEDIRGRLMSAIRIAKMFEGEFEKQRAEAAKLGLRIDDAALAELRHLSLQDDQSEFENMVDAALEKLATQPLVEVNESAKPRSASLAVLVSESRQAAIPVTDLIYANTDEREAKSGRIGDAVATPFPPPLRSMVRDLVVAQLASDKSGAALRPIYRYDDTRTLAAARRAEESVPTQYLTFERGFPLADPGSIDAAELERLAAEQRQFEAAMRTDPELRVRERFEAIGRFLLAFLVAAGIATYVSRARIRARKNPFRLIVCTLTLLAMLAVARGVSVFAPELPPHFAVGPQAFAAALLTILYPQRFALGASGALALLLCLANYENVGFFAVLLVVSAVFILGLGDIRQRGRVVGVGFLAGVFALITSVAAALIERQTPHFAMTEGLWAAGMSLAAGFVVEGMLPLIERFFGVSTNMTLLEWCDANKPLLRLMADRAPGTYNHSLLVGAIAESAAEAIGANGLLARAGAYYHDIGKINKPDYFIENQPHGASRHEGLSPAMSLLVIISHVKDGIEMAKEYKIPQSLRPFIAEHHGTTLVEYFYHAANKEREPDDPEVAETQFRYPGPRPQSRESAIVMMCDGVEGAVRSLSDPNPARIEAVVSQIVRKRLLDGQFDESDLTFRDLATIEQSLIKSLCGIYHGRVTYPEAEQRSA